MFSKLYIQRATVKAGTQECGTERGAEIRRKYAGNKMNVHAHIVKVHMVGYMRNHQVYSLAV